MNLYKATYYGLNLDGEELFSKSAYFSDRKKAFDYLFKITSEEFDETLSEYLYPDRVNLYTHITAFAESNGEYKYIKSAVYSYSESNEGERITQCNEPRLTYIP